MSVLAETVRYFAYGSNMCSTTFSGRRGIAFRSATAAHAPGYRLALDKPGMISTGHAYANLHADPAEEVWGVLYEITREDLEHIDLTEGVLIGNYRRIEIEVRPAAAPAVTAFTLLSDLGPCTLSPSTRYMGLLIAGALEHGLPDRYVEWLRGIPAVPEDAAAQAWLPILDDAMKRR